MLVLIVEDNIHLRTATALFLESCGYEVVAVEHVAAAVARFAEGIRPDAMLVDLTLPDVTGFEFREYQRKRADLQLIPVVFWSGRPLDPAEIRRLHGAPFLQKPTDPETLLEVIGGLLKPT